MGFPVEVLVELMRSTIDGKRRRRRWALVSVMMGDDDCGGTIAVGDGNGSAGGDGATNDDIGNNGDGALNDNKDDGCDGATDDDIDDDDGMALWATKRTMTTTTAMATA